MESHRSVSRRNLASATNGVMLGSGTATPMLERSASSNGDFEVALDEEQEVSHTEDGFATTRDQFGPNFPNNTAAESVGLVERLSSLLGFSSPAWNQLTHAG